MTPRQGMQGKVLASSIALVLILQPFAGAQDPPLPSPAPNTSQPAAPPAPAPDVTDPSAAPATPAPSAAPLPDSPGTLQRAPNSQPATQSNSPANDLATERRREPSEPSPDSDAPAQPQQTSPHEPRGTAAAETIQTTGVAASRPAGAAVAPAKQKRVRSILIKVGALVGVGVAVGTTMALSQGSPSRPPGAR